MKKSCNFPRNDCERLPWCKWERGMCVPTARARAQFARTGAAPSEGPCKQWKEKKVCAGKLACIWALPTKTRPGFCRRTPGPGRVRVYGHKGGAVTNQNPWLIYLKGYRNRHPGMTYKVAMQAASKEYQKQKGGYYY